MTDVPNLTTPDEIDDLVSSFRADDTVPVFSPEEDGVWVYASDSSHRLSPLKAVASTAAFHDWQAGKGAAS